jgi:hypothetical protein
VRHDCEEKHEETFGKGVHRAGKLLRMRARRHRFFGSAGIWPIETSGSERNSESRMRENRPSG